MLEVSRMITDADRAHIVRITRKLLEERFKDEFVFDPIVAVPEIDHYGDEVVEVFVVVDNSFDGENKTIDPVWSNTLEWLVIEELGKIGVKLLQYPGYSFVAESDWKRMHRKRYGAYESPRPD